VIGQNILTGYERRNHESPQQPQMLSDTPVGGSGQLSGSVQASGALCSNGEGLKHKPDRIGWAFLLRDDQVGFSAFSMLTSLDFLKKFGRWMNITTSASCSIAPFSRKSARRGSRLPLGRAP